MPLMLFAALVGPDLEPSRCLPRNQAGVIIAVDGKVRPGHHAPYVSRDNQTVSIDAYALICPGDIIVNPADSGVTAQYELSGQAAKSLAPGGDAVLVPKTSWLTRIVMLEDRVKDALDTYLIAAILTKGNEEEDDAPVYPLPKASFAVPEWGPLVIAWGGGAGGIVSVTRGTETKTFASAGLLKIDLATYCGDTCVVHVATPGISSDTRITTVSAERAIKGMFMDGVKQGDPPFVIASWFAANSHSGAWKLQKLSIAWNSACEVPQFGINVRSEYSLGNDVNPCPGN